MRERKLSRDPCEINWIRCTVHKWQTVMQRCFYAALRIENDIVLSKYDDRTTRISMTIIVNSSFLQESRNLRAKSRKYKRKFYWHGAGWLVEIVKRRSCACCECEMHSIQQSIACETMINVFTTPSSSLSVFNSQRRTLYCRVGDFILKSL